MALVEGIMSAQQTGVSCVSDKVETQADTIFSVFRKLIPPVLVFTYKALVSVDVTLLTT